MTSLYARWLGRAVALGTLLAFLFSCTKNEIRPSVEVQHFGVDWNHLEGRPLIAGSLQVQGIVLSPAQWPLETSLTRALSGDFTGMIDGFNLSFQSSKIPSGALQDLYDAGYVPVVARVTNPSNEAAPFLLTSLVIRDHNGAQLTAVDPAELPDIFKKIDWKQTGIAIAFSVLIVLVILASAKGHGGGGVYFNGGGGGSPTTAPPAERPQGRAAGDAGADQALLKPGLIPARSTREGVLFFRRADAGIVDWSTASLAAY